MATNVLDKLNKVPSLYKAIGLVAVLVLILVYFYFSEWTKYDQQVEGLKIKQDQLNRTFKEQQAVADNLATFKENTKKLEIDLQNALKQLPRTREIPTLLRDIYTLGKKSGIEFKIFEPKGVARKNLYAELPIRLQVSGTYHEIGVFFDRIGKMSRIVNVSEVDVKMGGKNDSNEEILNISCLATSFMFLGGGG